MNNLPMRMWVNQPSTLQPHHHLSGTNVLAIREDNDYYRVYFLSGATISMRMSKLSLSKGWLDTKKSALNKPKGELS